MDSASVRQKFLDFFRSKNHQIVPSAPLVIKDDPTLMFTNAGMNQFKDYFLGNEVPTSRRVADTQKCLRVSGKHNDLEEVGIDTYHHTMFEMLGNWSFGDYFKEEAIEWAWELLTEVYQLPKERLYITVFGGDEKDGLQRDDESASIWRKFVAEEKILYCSKKDNFWEMGDTGPCGPCSEIHIDLRGLDEIKRLGGREMVNKDHPQVIEIWNLVFIQFNRKANGALENLPDKHVDTGMGLERLVRAVHGMQSNYDSDIFQLLIREIESQSGLKYGLDEKVDIAMRVISDHIRAVAFCIADGQLPSNTGAGYVIRRILRRAVRYGYSSLGIKSGLLYNLVPVLSEQFKTVFPELKEQEDFVRRVIQEEESSFFQTLEVGIVVFNNHLADIAREQLLTFLTKTGAKVELDGLIIYINGSDTGILIRTDSYPATPSGEGLYSKISPPSDSCSKDEINWVYEWSPQNLANNIDLSKVPELNLRDTTRFEFSGKFSGELVFLLFDRYGFPIDLTQLLAKEVGWSVDLEGFEKELQKQKDRSRKAATSEKSDWQGYGDSEDVAFVGYDLHESEARILKTRVSSVKGNKVFELVLDKTPFYAESGGQIGDTGILLSGNEQIKVLNTVKENNLIIHHVEKLPKNPELSLIARIDNDRRQLIRNNHSATHLLHAALREVLGTHVAQKGSLVSDKLLRFDFSHFSKMTEDEILNVERIVNRKIRENIALDEKREVAIQEAKKMGAMALFGEKYGDKVRVITFDPTFSVELCGGTHVKQTGQIGIFKIVSESAIAAGVRRIEALTADYAESYIYEEEQVIRKIKEILKHPKEIDKALTSLIQEKAELAKQVEKFSRMESSLAIQQLLKAASKIDETTIIVSKCEISNADSVKQISFELKQQFESLILILACDIQGKPLISVMLSDDVLKTRNLDAGALVREFGKMIEGGGGGQKFYATAGGKKLSGLDDVVQAARKMFGI